MMTFLMNLKFQYGKVNKMTLLHQNTVEKLPCFLLGGVLCVSVVATGNGVVISNQTNSSNQEIIGESALTSVYEVFTNKTSYINITLPSYTASKESTVYSQNIDVNVPKARNIKKLEQIASLPNNWNGNGALSLSQSLIAKVQEIINFLNIQPEIFPTAYGTIQLEYDRPNNAHLEIEISQDINAEVFKVDDREDETIWYIASNAKEINKVVDDFYG